MTDKNLIVVDTIEGLYDEKAEARSYKINYRIPWLWCIKHRWVNASLYWSKEFGENDIGSQGVLFHFNFEGKDWGNGYGSIRFCVHCKHIECIHVFNEKSYKVATDDFYYVGSTIGTCKICKKRILRQSWGSHHSSDEAVELILKIAKELGKNWTGHPTTSGYGSNYFTILPSTTARLLKRSKEEAEAYVRNVFRSGHCS